MTWEFLIMKMAWSTYLSLSYSAAGARMTGSRTAGAEESRTPVFPNNFLNLSA